MAPLQTGLGLSGGGLCGSLRDDIRLVNGTLDHLLLVRVKVLCEIFVECGLFLLKA